MLLIIMLQMVNHLDIKQKQIEKKQSDSTNWKSRKHWPTSALPVSFLNAEFAIQFKHVSSFSRFLDLPLNNCELELDLWCLKDCVLLEHQNNITIVMFMVISTKVYVPVVTFSVNNNKNFCSILHVICKNQRFSCLN